MGEVFRARDDQLKRDVAVKVLPAAFSEDPDRRRRFEQEARAAGGLNHPNILAVHDVGFDRGLAYIVTELLDGETLHARLAGGPLSAGKATDYARQIADGLAAAHDRGVVHRDIKPANLFITTDGRVKILDFGLAKLIGPDAPSQTETVAVKGAQGSVIGTVTYMSPEVARGLRVDHRTDIFSFGVVFYEMLAGFPPFRRATSGDTLNAILRDEPSELPRTDRAIPALERIIRHCLEKQPVERFQNFRDLIFHLDNRPQESDSVALPARRVRLRWPAATAIGLVSLAVAAAIGHWSGRQMVRPAPSPTVYTVHRQTDFPGLEEFPAISPDRRSVAFTSTVGGHRQIFVRLLAGGSPVPITTDPADHQLPRWLPDGNSLVYFSPAGPDEAQGEIWSIPALGGSRRRVIDSIGSADVSRDGRLTCFRLVDGNVQLVTAALDGTDVRVVARSAAGYHRYPRFSPDGGWIAFQRGDGVRYDVFVIPATGGEPRQLTHDRNIIRGLTWLPDSSGVVYGSSRGSTVPYLPPSSLWEVKLDGGAPRQITPSDVWYEQPDLHRSGVLSAARVRIQFDIWSFPFEPLAPTRARQPVQVTHQTGQVLTPTAAPNGSELAFLSDTGGHGNLWVMSTQGGELRQITFEDDPGVAVGVPLWSPDGRSIAFVSSKGRTGYDFGVWLVDPDGRNLRNVVAQGLGVAWSPDSQWLYYAETAAGVLNKVPAAGGAPTTVRSEPTRNVIGLHGATLYYTVERPLLDGRPQVEIRAATPEEAPSRVIATISASRVPSWQIVNPALSPDGEWLAMPLTDGGLTTNVWALSTRTGAWRQVTDFGDRATFVVRRVSWSSDSRSIFAAVGEGNADIVLLDGLIPAERQVMAALSAGRGAGRLVAGLLSALRSTEFCAEHDS